MNIDGTKKKEINTNLDRSISSIKWSSDSKKIYFSYDNFGNTKVGYTTLSGNVKTLVHNLGGTTIGRPYAGGSYSLSNNGDLVYTLTSPFHPADISYFNGDETIRVTNFNYDLFKDKDLGDFEEMWYNSSVDGRKIQGWIARPPGFDINKKYPNINFDLFNGEKTSIGELINNGPLVIQFWAIWCSPCKKEMVFLDKFERQYKDNGLSLIHI